MVRIEQRSIQIKCRHPISFSRWRRHRLPSLPDFESAVLVLGLVVGQRILFYRYPPGDLLPHIFADMTVIGALLKRWRGEGARGGGVLFLIHRFLMLSLILCAVYEYLLGYRQSYIAVQLSAAYSCSHAFGEIVYRYAPESYVYS